MLHLLPASELRPLLTPPPLLLVAALLLLASRPANPSSVSSSSDVLAALQALPTGQRTAARATGLCAEQTRGRINCAWLVLSGSSGGNNQSIGSSGPVEFLTCFDQLTALCRYRPPTDRFTLRSDCMSCDACGFDGCRSDAAGCRVACACSCGGGSGAVIPCYRLCDGVSQCPLTAAAASTPASAAAAAAAAVGVDEIPEYCSLMAATTAAPTGPVPAAASTAAAISAGVVGTVLLAAALAAILCRLYRRTGDGGLAVEWRRLPTSGGGFAGEGESGIPLSGDSQQHSAAA